MTLLTGAKTLEHVDGAPANAPDSAAQEDSLVQPVFLCDATTASAQNYPESWKPGSGSSISSASGSSSSSPPAPSSSFASFSSSSSSSLAAEETDVPDSA